MTTPSLPSAEELAIQIEENPKEDQTLIEAFRNAVLEAAAEVAGNSNPDLPDPLGTADEIRALKEDL